MERKNIVIIAALVIVICILTGIIFATMTKSVEYERIELAPNATSIEIPKEDLKYEGEMNGTGAKLWTFKKGSLTTYNSEEALNARGLYGLGGAVGLKTIKEMILNHYEKEEEIDGFTVYTVNGKDLGINGRDTLYCIITGNDDTHDNIVITVDDKDVALHMAKSIQYKSMNSTKSSTNSDNTVSTGSSNHNNASSKNKYTEEDLARANEAGYYSGYSDGYSDSYDDYYYDDYETSTSTDSSQSSSDHSSSSGSSSSSSSIETTVDN